MCFQGSEGELLGYIVSERGIKANPKKIMATSNMGPIRNVKGIQRLTVGVSNRRALNQLVNLYYVCPILDGDAKRHKVYTGLGNGCPTSSLRVRSCIPCTEMLVVGVTNGPREGASPRSLRGAAWVA